MRYREIVENSGIDFDMTFDDDTGSFATVTARAQGRVLGSVKFFMDGDTLEADMVEVDERYRGQGIAAAMYDYAKSQGYTVEKSDALTPDGEHFWNKNRGEQAVWENTAAGINKMFNNLGDPVYANLQRVALLAMQGRQQEAQGRLNSVIKDASPQVQKKIIDAVNVIKPVTINGRVADSSTLDKSKAHQDWILNTFIPWVQSLLGQQGVAEGSKYKCSCHSGDPDPDCPVHGLEPMEVGDALDVKKGVAEGKQPGKPVVDAILKVIPVAQEIWFHGSRATGSHRKNSDTDILVIVPDDLVGDQYLGAVRILQKLSTHFDNHDIQPTKSGTNIHRIAQEEGQLLWSNKQGVAEGENNDTAISLSKLGKFHPGADSLAEFVPERATAQYALHPDKWESTFYSLTNKDSEKLKYYGPKKISIPPGTLVGDMAIANKFYRAKTPEEKQQYAELYKASLQPYPVDVSEYRMPELLIPRQGMAESSLGNVLPWPEAVNKINSAMKAMGWKGQRRDDGSFMFSTRGAVNDEFYIVIVDNQGNSMFTYALGTVEEGDPHIGEQDTLPTTEASISELMNAIRDGFGLNENFHDGRNPQDKGDLAEKINPKTLTRGFVQEKDMGWYTLQAVGDFASRMADEPPTMQINAMLKSEAGKRQVTQIGQLDLKIAHGMYLKNNPGAEALVAGGVWVDDAYQRKGVASAMYAFAKELGNDVIASVDQSDDAKAMWAGMQAKGVAENFHDGRNPQDKGDSKRHGVPTKASISTLRKVAKQGGRKGQLAHWMANMKSGRAKAKRK
jgi:GNAT superfamily N-acetyltransferase